MDYIIVVWNEIVWKILDKGRNLGPSLIIENHTSMKNTACSKRGRGARQRDRRDGRDKHIPWDAGTGCNILVSPGNLPSSGSPCPRVHSPAWTPLPVAVGRGGSGQGWQLGLRRDTGTQGARGRLRVCLRALEDRGASL